MQEASFSELRAHAFSNDCRSNVSILPNSKNPQQPLQPPNKHQNTIPKPDPRGADLVSSAVADAAAAADASPEARASSKFRRQDLLQGLWDI